MSEIRPVNLYIWQFVLHQSMGNGRTGLNGVDVVELAMVELVRAGAAAPIHRRRTVAPHALALDPSLSFAEEFLVNL